MKQSGEVVYAHNISTDMTSTQSKTVFMAAFCDNTVM